MPTINFAKAALTVMLSVTVALGPISQSAQAYGGEDYLNGFPWHHHDITFRVLAGDAAAYSEADPYRHPETDEETDRVLEMPAGIDPLVGAGFSRDAAMSIAWHADYIDSYLYNPFFWAEATDFGGGFNRRLKAALSMYDDLATLHFDDTFNTTGIIDNFERYAAGTLIGLKWAANKNDTAAAHHILGLSLHAIQDFYSHTDWINDPARRDLTWFEMTPAERERLSILAGAFENNAYQAREHHGAISASCSLLQRPGIKETLGPVCTGRFSPFQNMNFCATFKNCDDEDVVPVDFSVDAPLIGNVASSSLLYLNPKGIAVDSTLISRVGGEVRGLTTGKDGGYQFTNRSQSGFSMSPEQCVATINFGIKCKHDEYEPDSGPKRVGAEKCTRAKAISDYRCALDTDYLFATSKKLAIRASEQWVSFIEAAMNDMDEGDFWRRIKRNGSALSYRENQFERFENLPFQFITTGPYPVGNSGGAQTSDGYYLRIRIKTSDEKYSGTNADIMLLVEGAEYQQEVLLDYLPTNDPNGRASNPIFVYNDFERGDDDVYTVGPFPAPPLRITIANEAPSAGEVFVAFWKGLGETVVAGFEKTAKGMRALVGGGVDYVNDDHKVYTVQEIRGLQGYFPNGQFRDELRIKEKNEGDFGVRFSLRDQYSTDLSEDEETHKERRALGWVRYAFSFDEVFAYEESEIDGLSNSDELLIYSSVTPFNGDPEALPMFYRSGVIDDVDEGERHSLHRRKTPSRQSIILAPNSSFTVAGQIYESDLETTSERNDLWQKFTARGDEEVRVSKGFAVLAGEATASDFRIDHIVVTPFRRSVRPQLGKSIRYDIKSEIKGGEAFFLALKDHEMQDLIPADKPDVTSWFTQKIARLTQPEDATTENNTTASTAAAETRPGFATARPEFRDSIQHIKLDALTPEARAKFNSVRFEKFQKFSGPLNGLFQSKLGRRMSLIHIGNRVSGSIDNFGELEGNWDSATSTMTGTITYDTLEDGLRVADITLKPHENGGYQITAKLQGLDHVAKFRMTKIITIDRSPIKYSQYKNMIGRNAVKTTKITRTGLSRLSVDQPKVDKSTLSPYQKQYADE